jgi:hypothetical protein
MYVVGIRVDAVRRRCAFWAGVGQFDAIDEGWQSKENCDVDHRKN